MRQLVFNQYEKLGSTDFNNAQLAMNQTLADDFLANYFGKPASGVLGASLKGTFVSALASSIAAGVGFLQDSSQTGYNTQFRMIKALTSVAVTHVAANTQSRIDLVCLTPNLGPDTSFDEQRYIKTGGTGPIVLATVHKLNKDTFTLTVVTGTPGASPATPSTPAGSMALYSALIHANTGMASGADITDLRTILTFAIANSGHGIATSTTLQGQLDQLDAQAVAQADTATPKLTTINPGTQSPFNILTTVTTGHNNALFIVNSANGPQTFNLPAPVANFHFTVKDIAGALGTNPITMHRNASEKFENLAADYVMSAPYGEWEVFSDGTNWYFGGR